MEPKQSNKQEVVVVVPKNEKFIQIPLDKWESLKIEIDLIDPAGTRLPGFIGIILGFWFSTLLFIRDKLIGNDLPSIAFLFLGLGALIAFGWIYKKEKVLIGNAKNELKEIINEVEN